MKAKSTTWTLLVFFFCNFQILNSFAQVKGGEVGNPAASLSKLCTNSSSRELFFGDVGFTEAGAYFKPTLYKLINQFSSICQKNSNDEQLIVKDIFQSCLNLCKERATSHSNNLSVTEKVFTNKKEVFDEVTSKCQQLCDGIKIGLNAFRAGSASLREDCQNPSRDSISNTGREMKKIESTLIKQSSQNISGAAGK